MVVQKIKLLHLHTCMMVTLKDIGKICKECSLPVMHLHHLIDYVFFARLANYYYFFLNRLLRSWWIDWNCREVSSSNPQHDALLQHYMWSPTGGLHASVPRPYVRGSAMAGNHRNVH